MDRSPSAARSTSRAGRPSSSRRWDATGRAAGRALAVTVGQIGAFAGNYSGSWTCAGVTLTGDGADGTGPYRFTPVASRAGSG